MVNIGKRVRTLREARGWTQTQLAERSGISQKTVSAIEGKASANLYPSTMQALLRAFDLTMEEFMRPDEEESLPAQALALTDRLLSQDAQASPEAGAAYRSWLGSAARKRLEELAGEQSPPAGAASPGGRSPTAPPSRRRT